jgi:small conductance mechanosensitive channel
MQETTPATTNANGSLVTDVLLKDELDQMQKIYQFVVDYLTQYSFQILAALIIFVIGYVVAGKIARWVLTLCEKQSLDVTLSRFLANTSRMLIVVMISIISLGKLGISVTPFIAAIGAVSLGAGLALQGLLSNYAAGFNIILTRPFVVGDTIKVQGVVGIVKEVLLAQTVLIDEDNVEIMIPNKHIVGEILHNAREASVIELTVGIGYQHNPLEVCELLLQALTQDETLAHQQPPQIGIDHFGDSAIVLGVRLWMPTHQLFQSKYRANQCIYNTLQQANITIPFPQQVVHLQSTKGS